MLCSYKYSVNAIQIVASVANSSFAFWNFLEFFFFEYFQSEVSWIQGYRTCRYIGQTILITKLPSSLPHTSPSLPFPPHLYYFEGNPEHHFICKYFQYVTFFFTKQLHGGIHCHNAIIIINDIEHVMFKFSATYNYQK